MYLITENLLKMVNIFNSNSHTGVPDYTYLLIVFLLFLMFYFLQLFIFIIYLLFLFFFKCA